MKVFVPYTGAVSQVLDSLEEIQCLTECAETENGVLEKVLQDTKLHALLNVSYFPFHASQNVCYIPYCITFIRNL